MNIKDIVIYIPYLVLIFVVWYFFSYKWNFSYKKFISSEERPYFNILHQVATNPSDLKVSQVNHLLDLAEKEGFLTQFKVWLLKQKLSPGVRTKIEIISDLMAKKLEQKITSYICETCKAQWDTYHNSEVIFKKGGAAFETHVWERGSSCNHLKNCCPQCCDHCWKWTKKD